MPHLPGRDLWDDGDLGDGGIVDGYKAGTEREATRKGFFLGRVGVGGRAARAPTGHSHPSLSPFAKGLQKHPGRPCGALQKQGAAGCRTSQMGKGG